VIIINEFDYVVTISYKKTIKLTNKILQ